jgi:hypothetical protein
MSAIVAGILNTRTGEVLETTDNASAKTRLLLKVRDEMNVEHGKGAFMVFDFDSTGGMGNLDYVRRNLLADNPAILKDVEALKAAYNLEQTQIRMDRLKAELAMAEEAKAQCLAVFGDNDSAKREFVDGALSEEIDLIQAEIDTLQSKLTHDRRRVADSQR